MLNQNKILDSVSSGGFGLMMGDRSARFLADRLMLAVIFKGDN